MGKIYKIILGIVAAIIALAAVFFVFDKGQVTAPKTGNQTVVNSPYACAGNDKYFVVWKENDGKFLVKYKTAKDQAMACDYVVAPGDYEVITPGTFYFFMKLEDNFLVLDFGTAPPPRGFDVYDLAARKKVYEGSYSGPVSFNNQEMTYWDSTKEKATSKNCSSIDEWAKGGLGAEIQAHVTLDFSTLVNKDSGERRCSALQ